MMQPEGHISLVSGLKKIAALTADIPPEDEPMRIIRCLVLVTAADLVTFSCSGRWVLSEALYRNREVLECFDYLLDNPDKWKCNHLGPEIYDILRGLPPDDILHVPGRVYEHMMAHRTGSGSQRGKKSKGVYYTSPDIVRYMVDGALAHVCHGQQDCKQAESLKIIDPACGGGAFLIELWKKLRNLGMSPLTALRCVFGLDIDPAAVELTKFVLTMAVTTASRDRLRPADVKKLLDQQVRVGNALSKHGIQEEGPFLAGEIYWPVEFPRVFPTGLNSNEEFQSGHNRGFDLVIGNPPYVANKLLEGWDKDYYRQHFATARAQFDLCVPFIEQAINLLRPGGVLCFITPNKFLAADYGREIRQLILGNMLLDIIDVSTMQTFTGISVYPVIFNVRKEQGQGNSVRLVRADTWQQLLLGKQEQVKQEFFIRLQDGLITTALDKDTIPVMEKLSSCRDRLDQGIIRCGLAATGFGRWITDDACLATSEEKYRPVIQAGHITPFAAKVEEWIDASHINLSRWTGLNEPKLVIPGIAKHLTAAIDRSGSLLGRVYYIRESETPINLWYLAVLFNSQVLNFFYRILYWPVHLQGGYLRFNSGYLANLPLPAQGSELNSLTGQIEASGEALGNSVSPANRSELMVRADALVFMSYGLDVDKALTVMRYNGITADKTEKIITAMEGLC